MPVTSIRLDDDDLKFINEMAKRQASDRTQLIKKAITLGIKDMMLEEALGRYQRGEASAWECARMADVTLWEFLDTLKSRGIYFRTDEDELERALKEFE